MDVNVLLSPKGKTIFLFIFLFSFGISSCIRRQKTDQFHYHQSFDELKGWFPLPATLSSEIKAHSGMHCIYTDEKDAYSPTFQIKFKDIGSKKPKRMKASVWCYTTSKSCEGKLCLQIKNKAGEYKLWLSNEFKTAVKSPNKWTWLEVSSDIAPEVFSPENDIALYVWNTGKGKVYADDFALEFVP